MPHIFRNTDNNKLYYIQQRGRGQNITPHKDAKFFFAKPYRTNPNLDSIKIYSKVISNKFKLAFYGNLT